MVWEIGANGGLKTRSVSSSCIKWLYRSCPVRSDLGEPALLFSSGGAMSERMRRFTKGNSGKVVVVVVDLQREGQRKGETVDQKKM